MVGSLGALLISAEIAGLMSLPVKPSLVSPPQPVTAPDPFTGAGFSPRSPTGPFPEIQPLLDFASSWSGWTTSMRDPESMVPSEDLLHSTTIALAGEAAGARSPELAVLTVERARLYARQGREVVAREMLEAPFLRLMAHPGVSARAKLNLTLDHAWIQLRAGRKTLPPSVFEDIARRIATEEAAGAGVTGYRIEYAALLQRAGNIPEARAILEELGLVGGPRRPLARSLDLIRELQDHRSDRGTLGPGTKPYVAAAARVLDGKETVQVAVERLRRRQPAETSGGARTGPVTPLD